jgi:glycosyltransferase involved in cell wall biosynthesis
MSDPQEKPTPAPGKAPELSVVVLCYRAEELAEEFCAQLARELSENSIDYELILVANYEPDVADRTPEIVQRLTETQPRLKAVTRPKEGKMGWDMRSGLDAATGDHIAVIDGDGQMPSSDVAKVYRVLQVGGYDLVKTFRANRDDGVYRRTISAVYNLLFRLLFPATRQFRDINSKPKVMTRAAYRAMHLVSNDWFTDAEIMIEAIRNSLRVGEVSTVFYDNERRSSFVRPSAIWEFVCNIFYYRFRSLRGPR